MYTKKTTQITQWLTYTEFEKMKNKFPELTIQIIEPKSPSYNKTTKTIGYYWQTESLRISLGTIDLLLLTRHNKPNKKYEPDFQGES